MGLNEKFAVAKRVALDATLVRDLGESDLAALAVVGPSGVRPIQAIRDRHHAVARLIAAGSSNIEVASVTGYTPERITQLLIDPKFIDLVAEYRSVADSAHADFVERANLAANTAMSLILDRLEETPEAIETKDLLRIAESAGDRAGHAPVAKSLNINVSAGFGERLARSREQAKVIDAKAS